MRVPFLMTRLSHFIPFLTRRIGSDYRRLLILDIPRERIQEPNGRQPIPAHTTIFNGDE